MIHVLVITTEPLPVPGGLTTGAGLRAWGLAEGLRSRGFRVTLATPLEGEQAQAQAAQPTDDRVVYFARPDLPHAIAAAAPDVIVMQHWGLMYQVPQTEIPLVIDLAGPHLLERLYWGTGNAQRDFQEKIHALSRADFVICGGHYQRHYFYPYLHLAGFDITRETFPVIPFSVPPDPPAGEPAAGAEPTFIYGGAFLAWQNPADAIDALLDEMDAAGRGRLLFYGGSHPQIDASGGRFQQLYRRLKDHPRVEMRGWKPFAQLAAEYATEGHVALDLMQHNPERELAYTTRTMVYLWCGLPVIYNNYSEISPLIEQHQCGWTLHPDDDAELRRIIRTILADPDRFLALREKARAAALAQSWDKTIGPLADYCAQIKTEPAESRRARGPVLLAPAAPPPAPPPETSKSGNSQTFSGLKGRTAGNLLYLPIWLLCRYLQRYLK